MSNAQSIFGFKGINNPILCNYFEIICCNFSFQAFVDKFSEDLASEYTHHGVIVQSVLPGPVATKMSKIKKANWMACSAKTFVDSALKTVECARHTTGYYPHSLLLAATNLMFLISPSITQRISLKTMNNIKTRYLKKKKRNE